MVDFDKPSGPSPGYGPGPYPPPGPFGAPGYPLPGYPAGPGYGPGYGPGTAPSSNIGWAVAALVLFWPLAIPAFVYSSRVEPFWYRGEFAAAHKASHDARTWGLAGVIVGAVLWVVGILIIVLVFVVLANTVQDFTHHLPTFTPSPFPT